MDGQGISPLQRFKRMSGLFLFWLSWLLWVLVFVIPFMLDAEVATLAMISTSLLVAAEISFIGSLLLLGRPFYQAVKLHFNTIWHKIVNSGKKS